MNHLKVLLMIVMLAGCFSLGSWAQTQNREKLDYLFPKIPAYRSFRPTAKFVSKVKLPAVPEKLNVYEVQPAIVNEESVRRLAESFGMRGKAQPLQDGKWEVVETAEDPRQRRTLTIYEASGGFTYMFNNLLFAPTDQQPKLPSEQESFELAVRFLKENSLLPPDAGTNMQQVRFSKPTLIERSAKEKKNLKEIVTNIEVRFNRILDGFTVRGPGSKLYVAFGEGNRILGITRVWRDVKKAEQTLPSIKPADALQLLQQGAGVMDAPAECTQADVKSMLVVFWMESPAVRQRVSLPVYRVEGQCVSAEGKVLGDFQAYAPAVLNVPLRRTK